MIDGTERLIIKDAATIRGLSLVEFTDLYDKPCTFQESSIATADCCWLGTGEDRMHLNRIQAVQVASMLMEFARLGEVKKPSYNKIEKDLINELDDMFRDTDDETEDQVKGEVK